jgi:hypothetical protein
LLESPPISMKRIDRLAVLTRDHAHDAHAAVVETHAREGLAFADAPDLLVAHHRDLGRRAVAVLDDRRQRHDLVGEAAAEPADGPLRVVRGRRRRRGARAGRAAAATTTAARGGQNAHRQEPGLHHDLDLVLNPALGVAPGTPDSRAVYSAYSVISVATMSASSLATCQSRLVRIKAYTRAPSQRSDTSRWRAASAGVCGIPARTAEGSRPTTTAALAREVATLSRLALYRNSSPRGARSGLDVPMA